MSVAITSGLLRRVLVLAMGFPSLGKAAVVIDWGAAGVTFTTISATQAVVTGVTTGDAAIPFTATFNTVGSNLALSSGMTGGVFSVPLVNHPAPRNAGTQTTISITLTGYQMSGTSFALLDVDWAGAGASWQDSVTVTSPGAVLTSVNSAFTSVSGNTVLGIGGNVPNSTPNGNVNVAIGSILSAITMTFGAGPVDGFAGGQTIGISNISITSALLDAPEPSTITFIVVGALLMAVGLRKRRRA